MADILQMTFSNLFTLMIFFVYWFQYMENSNLIYVYKNEFGSCNILLQYSELIEENTFLHV